MTTAGMIYELVKTLPEDKAHMVLRFAKFLRQDTSSLANLYGSGADDEFEVDDEGISDPLVATMQFVESDEGANL